MPPPPSAPKRPRIWVIVAVAVLGVGLGSLFVWMSRPVSADRVLLLSSSLDSQGKEVGPGMATLMSDCLEVLAGATVTHVPVLPAKADLHRLPPQTRVLRFQAHREGTQLALTLEWNSVDRLLAEKPWSQKAMPAMEPGRAMNQAVRHWPLAHRYRQLEALIPKSPDGFWALLEGLSIQDDLEATNHLTASRQLTLDEPRCAAAWAALGDHLYRSIWINPEQAGSGLSSRTHKAFLNATDLVPGYPRATFLWSLMLTDTGNQNRALKTLKEALQLRPGIPDLYLGLAYAGRTSGLLEGARRALIRRGEVLGTLAPPTAWFAETTYLYLNDQEAFGRELDRAGSLRKDANILFYKGYFAMLQGKPKAALGFLRSGSDPAMTPAPFRDLCRVYRAYLEGKPNEGLQELREIDDIRGKLRIPDGEWTFKEAEAYSLLGDTDRGIDCATRAFVQGFSCAVWYETSPFLAGVRKHPRWPTLRRNIRERQAVMEGSFPTSAFEP